MGYKFLKVQSENRVTTLAFSRPEALNALNQEMMDEFLRFLKEVKEEGSTGCLILTGDGEKSFIAGADIKEMHHFTVDQAKLFSDRGHQALLEIESLNFPVIAAVNGFALGGGCEMAMACDFILASEKASFGLPEVTLGLIPGFGGTQRLPKFVGLPKASEMIFTGQRYSAQEARAMGLVNQVIPPGELMVTAYKIATTIVSRGPVAIAHAKKSLRAGYSLPLKDGLKIEGEMFSKLFVTEDQKEGAQAFIEKRSPQFCGV